MFTVHPIIINNSLKSLMFLEKNVAIKVVATLDLVHQALECAVQVC